MHWTTSFLPCRQDTSGDQGTLGTERENSTGYSPGAPLGSP